MPSSGAQQQAMTGRAGPVGAGAQPWLADRIRGHDNNFNLLRMVAASGVLVSHAWPIALGPGVDEPLERLTGLTLGTACVIVFFAVSGFFITRSMDTGRAGWPGFLRARALRLLPGLAAVLLLTALVLGPLLTTAPAATYWHAVPDYLLRNLTLARLRYDLPGVFETVPYGPPINGSLWTLFYEVACYGLVLLAGVTGLLRRRRLALGMLLLALAGFLAAERMALPGRLEHLVQLGLPFALGGSAWLWRDRVPASPGLAAGLALATAAAIWLLGTGHPLVALLRVLTLSYASLWFGFARTPWLRPYNRLGDYSYGMYVYAFPVQQLMAQLGFRDPLGNIAAALPVVLVCAILSWYLVESPAQRLGRRPPVALATP